MQAKSRRLTSADIASAIGIIAVFLVAGLLIYAPMIAVALVVGGLVATACALKPRVGLGLWLLTVAAVPHWLGVEVGLYLPPLTLIGVLLVPAIVGAQTRLNRVDVILFLVFVGATALTLLVGGSQAMWAAMVTQWGLAYLVGRRLTARTGVEWAGQAFAHLMLLVATFAIIEYIQDWHPFVDMLGSSASENQWVEILTRGGDARSEASFGHPIALGGALTAAIPFVLGGRASTAWKLATTAILILGVAVTISRGPLLAVAWTVLLVIWAARDLRLGGRLLIALTAIVGAAYMYPMLVSVTDRDSQAVRASSGIRSEVFTGLLHDMHIVGLADYTLTTPAGALVYRGYSTVDNAFFAVGIRFGWLLPAILALLLLFTAWRVLKRVATLPELALVGQIPVLLTVALITQYAAVIWFMAGLAVTWATTKTLEPPDKTTAKEPPPVMLGDSTGRQLT